MTIDDLMKAYRARKPEFDNLMTFVRTNQEIVQDFDLNTARILVAGFSRPYEKLYRAFLDAMQAAGGNNLTNSGLGCMEFRKKFPDPENDDLLSFEAFWPGKTTEVFMDSLTGPDMRNFKHKKAAILLKTIYNLQKLGGAHRIFSDISHDEIELKIPLDIVIGEILGIVLKIPFKQRIEGSRDFMLVNDWSKRVLGADYYLIEHLWFWGYFNTQKRQGPNYREIAYNEAKYLTNLWVFPAHDANLLAKFSEFREWVKA